MKEVVTSVQETSRFGAFKNRLMPIFKREKNEPTYGNILLGICSSLNNTLEITQFMGIDEKHEEYFEAYMVSYLSKIPELYSQIEADVRQVYEKHHSIPPQPVPFDRADRSYEAAIRYGAEVTVAFLKEQFTQQESYPHLADLIKRQGTGNPPNEIGTILKDPESAKAAYQNTEDVILAKGRIEQNKKLVTT